jgi:AcrR family transcriptional regulator
MADDTRERLIQATLEAIDRQISLRKLSLRGIARSAGCSHVNVYNHAGGLDGLLWLAYSRALQLFTLSAQAALEGPTVSDGKRKAPPKAGRFGEVLAKAMLDYACEHEGWYRLLWLEELPGTIPESAMAQIVQSASFYRQAVADALVARPGRLAAADSKNSGLVADLFFAYLQGELSMYLNRTPLHEREAGRALIIERSRQLWKTLLG